MLSLLVCPFLYQETMHAGIISKFIFASVAVAAGMKIYVAGEYNKALPAEQKTRLAKEGHPYLDATFGIAKNTVDMVSPVFSSAAKQLERASNTLKTQREEVVPALIEKYNPFGKSTTIKELEITLQSDTSRKKELEQAESQIRQKQKDNSEAPLDETSKDKKEGTLPEQVATEPSNEIQE